jgi:hypothetical protein
METTKKELELRPSTCGEICELDKSQLEQLKNWVQELIDRKASPSPSDPMKDNKETKPENPPAFPTQWDSRHQPESTTEFGMTLRDYFAAKAMQGLLTSPQMYEDVNDNKSCAKRAYDIADAMLAERSKQ